MKKPLLDAKHSENSFTIVAIGASVGGLEAVSSLLKNVAPDTGMAFIYVQHLSPDHKSLLAPILSKVTSMKVQEIENMELMLPNNVYVIPTTKIIEVTDGHIKLLPRPKNSSLISIDVLFTSLAETHKENVIGVVLSGNANDGTEGLKAIKQAGGLTFAQDNSAQASSMPQSAIAAGIIDFVLSPEEIGTKLSDFGKNGFPKKAVKEKEETIELDNSNDDLNSIFELLLKEKKVDFSHYKISTVKRRIQHKMQQAAVKTLQEYVELLQKSLTELDLLYHDLLINVTRFFRDIESFEYLENVLFPKLLNSKNANETLRIWIPACSTGEEAYSIAMIINHLQADNNKKIPVKIFATDLSEQAIAVARVGEYSQNDLKNIPQKYIENYFTKTGNVFCIAKEIREMCLFATQNILRDPPFSRMDFISCRNLLIYFDAEAQKKVFSTLHFALNETGYLMLGKAETVGNASPFFSQISAKYKIFTWKKTDIRKIIELQPRFPRTLMDNKKMPPATKNLLANPVGIEAAIDSVLLANYMPACAVVNKEMDILQFRGPVSLYLEHQSGKASLNILKMARPEFAFELRNAMYEAMKTKQIVYKSGIEIKIEGVLRTLSFEVSPLKIEWEEPLLLVVFKLHEEMPHVIEDDKIGKSNSRRKDLRIKKLETELNNIRTEMNIIIESQELTYEELQAANEENVSSNEEYQTLNEELETSKEEIEATNEELLSTNHELQMRNDLLLASYEYSEAIIATIHEPMLILDKNFHVKSANKSFYEKFQVKKEETEGQFLFDLGNKQWNIAELRNALHDIFSKNSSFENFQVRHTFSQIGEKIMLLNAHLIIQKANNEPLILLAIEDITDLKQSLKEVSDYKYALDASSIVEVTDKNGIIKYVNENSCKISQYSPDELIGKDHRIINSDYHSKGFMQDLWETISQGKIWNGDIKNRAKDGSFYWVFTTIVPFLDEKGLPYQYVAIRTDITDKKKAETELIEARVFAEYATEIAEDAQKKAEHAMQAKQQFLSNMSHEIRTPMNAIIGFTKVILKTNLSEKQKQYLSAIKTSGDALIVLINDILDLAKVDAGKITFEENPFKMVNSIAAMLHLFEAKIQEKNLVLETDYDKNIPVVLLGDAVRLHQIILNLISNAVKFTTKGKITVNVRLLDENEKQVSIEFLVSDTGIGIPTEKIDKIFENFQQASSETSRVYGGTGLGLAIAKQLVEKQVGKIWVKSEINKGSTFGFVLDFLKTNATIPLETEIIEFNPEIKNIKILVVEDMVLNQLLMQTLLDEFGFTYDIVDNGKIAIEKLASISLSNQSYDIILMDLQMPEMNGFEASEYIRKVLNINTPIIALTADVTTADLAKCTKVGMNDYVAKPLDERLLYSKIMNFVRKQPLIIFEETHQSEAAIQVKYTDLSPLMLRTKNNSNLIMGIISAYLAQTPPLINAMKQSLQEKDWTMLHAAVHKMIPSFSIMGMSADFETIAKKIQEYAHTQEESHNIDELVLQMEHVCTQACKELMADFERIKGDSKI